MKRIAWIGTGVMGRPMALHLKRAGYDVVVTNRSLDKALSMASEVEVADSIEACVKNADVVVTIVGYPNDVETVYQTCFLHAKPGALLIDMTTSSPRLAKTLAMQAKQRHLRMLDAPVTGGDIGAINATLSIMVGGERSDYEEALPIFSKLGKTITYMGPSGNGQLTKLSNQIAIAGAIAGLAEALSFAKRTGLDPLSALAVYTGGSATSWQAEKNGPKMIQADYRPGFFIKHFVKDLRLAIEEGTQERLPIASTVTTFYETLIAGGHENLGTQAIIEYYRSLS
jgi:3-hydroxyisobutyrate dehydrogenase